MTKCKSSIIIIVRARFHINELYEFRKVDLCWLIVYGHLDTIDLWNHLRELVRQEISSTLESRLHIDFHELLIALIPARGLSEHAWVLTNNYVFDPDYVTVGLASGPVRNLWGPLRGCVYLVTFMRWNTFYSLSLSLPFHPSVSFSLIHYAYLYFRVI